MINTLAALGKPFASVSSDPAANTEASTTVPSGGRGWLLISATVVCAQGATQTPLPSLKITDASGNVVGTFPGASAATSASTTSSFTWYTGATLTAGAGATANTAPIPEGLTLKPGWTAATSTAGKGANTDLGPLVLNVIKLN